MLKVEDEAGRLKALQRYGVLDTAREQEFDSITSLVGKLLEVPICGVSLIDQDRQWFKSLHGIDMIQSPRCIAFCDHTIRASNMLVVNDATADERFASNPLVVGEPFIRSYAGAPLMTPDGYNLGALCAIDRRVRCFSAKQLWMLEEFSSLIVNQLELRTLAHEDFLTRVLTRRAFMMAAGKAVRETGRGGTATLVTFDIDHFKRVNDRFGHAVGDLVLQAVASECRVLLRPGDLLGRMGGEEFGVLLPRTGMNEAVACAERLRAGIEALILSDCPRVTASFGIAELGTGVEVNEWFAQADAALYAAKQAGRNRCNVTSDRCLLAA